MHAASPKLEGLKIPEGWQNIRTFEVRTFRTSLNVGYAALVSGSATAASVGGMRSNLIFGQCGLTVAAIDRSLAGIAPDQTAGVFGEGK